jgi:hypothetical protein
MPKGTKAILTDDQILQVEKLAGVLNITQISHYLGIHSDTFQEIKKRDPRLVRAYQSGKAISIQAVASNLVGKALAGDTTAAIFYLKTQARWSEYAPETKFEEEEITETPEERADRMKKIKLYTEFENNLEAFTQWKKETNK